MEPRDRIIFPLDVPSVKEAQELVDELHDHVGSFKVGLEFTSNLLTDLLLHPEAESLLTAARHLFGSIGTKLFWDGKLKDIPNTVKGAALGASRLGVKMFNVHCSGGLEMMQAARQAADNYAAQNEFWPPLVLGVTVLTSMKGIVCAQSYGKSVEDKVLDFARLANLALLDGIICSPKELSMLKREKDLQKMQLVTPGVRPDWAQKNDQARTMTPAEAIAAGADYLVIGRPIRNPPQEVGTPMQAAILIAQEIETALARTKNSSDPLMMRGGLSNKY